jgi:hypothetical protein
MRSTIKISLTALLALALVLVLVTLLNVFKFESTLAEITRAKVDVIVDDVEQSIEAAIDLGLPLGGIGMGNDILARAKARDPRILDAIIFGSDGDVLFAAGAAPGSAKVDPSWLSVQRQSGGPGDWSIALDDTTIFGRRLDSSYSAGVGGVAFVYSNAADVARSDAVRDNLARSALASFAIFGALAVLATILALGGMRRLIGGLVRGLGGGGDDATLPADLATSIRGFRGSVHEAEREIAAAAGLNEAFAAGDRP